MLKIASLTIENFRGVRYGHIRFGTHTVLIGPNNCGKTTIIEALTLLFGRDRLVRALTEHDFLRSEPSATDRIRLTATIYNFAGDDPEHFPDWFRDQRAIPKWLDIDSGKVLAQRTGQVMPLCCQIGFAARFDRPSLEVESMRYFHDDDRVLDIFDDETVTPVPSKLVRELGLFLVPANRTWDRVVSFGSELFRRVVASGNGPPAESVLAERDRLRAPSAPLEADPNLSALINEVNKEMSGFFRTAPTLHLRLTATDSEGVLDAVMPHYRHVGQALALPAKRHGSGLISMQWLLLLLHFGRNRAAQGEGFWMALEEPELHVPPALQRRLIYRIQALSTQTFVSTHSPLVAAIADPASIVLVRNDNGALSTLPLLPMGFGKNTPNAVRKLFQLNRIETVSALMHDAMLLPEGRLDAMWLRLILKAIDVGQVWDSPNECKFDSHVGVISTHDAAVVESYGVLRELHPRIGCLLDGDEAGSGYLKDLLALSAPPTILIQWPDDWTIEDVVGWIVEPEAHALLSRLASSGNIPSSPKDLPELVQRLKSADRNQLGLKGDEMSCEAIVEAIASEQTCHDRACALMNALSDVLAGDVNPMFSSTASGTGTVSKLAL